MELRRIRDEADARTCLAATKKAGLSLARWGRSAGVGGRSLHAWRMNLTRGELGQSRRARRSKSVQLVELVAAATPARREHARHTVRFGRLSVEIGEDFDAATLRRQLSVLASCCKLRLNALFAASTEGAHRACVLLGIAATCRALGISAPQYMTWAFERLGTHRDLYGLDAVDVTPAAFVAARR